MSICSGCNKEIKTRKFEWDGKSLCRHCFDIRDYYRLFYRDVYIKIFIDCFNQGNDIFCSYTVLDIKNQDFTIKLEKSKCNDLHLAHYEIILKILETYKLDLQYTVIFTNSKIIINHISGNYKIRTKELRKKFILLEKSLNKGLKIEYVCPEHNFARMNPYNFIFLQEFENYNRGIYYIDKKEKQFFDSEEQKQIEETSDSDDD